MPSAVSRLKAFIEHELNSRVRISDSLYVNL